jgi:hypothetical protein
MAVYAHGGEFMFDDHVSNWSVICRNLNFSLVRAPNLNTILGIAEFTNGTTHIGKFPPLRTDFSTRFQLQGSKVLLKHIDLVTDGARSHVNGYVNFGNWPEQQYSITSEVVSRGCGLLRAGSWNVSGASLRRSSSGRSGGRQTEAGRTVQRKAGLSIRTGGDFRTFTVIWLDREHSSRPRESDFWRNNAAAYGFPWCAERRRLRRGLPGCRLCASRQFGFVERRGACVAAWR